LNSYLLFTKIILALSLTATYDL